MAQFATFFGCADPAAAPQSATAERDVRWEEVERALEAGKALRLYRLALDGAVAVGDVEGMPLDAPGKWPLEEIWSAVLALADERRALGGLP